MKSCVFNSQNQQTLKKRNLDFLLIQKVSLQYNTGFLITIIKNLEKQET